MPFGVRMKEAELEKLGPRHVSLQLMTEVPAECDGEPGECLAA